MGRFTRNLTRDALCTYDQAAGYTPDEHFAACSRDVTGYGTPPDSMPEPTYNGMNNFAKAGAANQTQDEIRRLHAAPVLDVTQVVDAVITIRAAGCSGRPTTPAASGATTGVAWPGAPTDCPSWYLEARYSGDCMQWDDALQQDVFEPAPCWVQKQMDSYTECASGSCYFVDLHVPLGGTTAGSRTTFGSPANSANGFDAGAFFIYDPRVGVSGVVAGGAGGGNSGDQSPMNVAWNIVGALVGAVAFLLLSYLLRTKLARRRLATAGGADSSHAKPTGDGVKV